MRYLEFVSYHRWKFFQLWLCALVATTLVVSGLVVGYTLAFFGIAFAVACVGGEKIGDLLPKRLCWLRPYAIYFGGLAVVAWFGSVLVLDYNFGFIVTVFWVIDATLFSTWMVSNSIHDCVVENFRKAP